MPKFFCSIFYNTEKYQLKHNHTTAKCKLGLTSLQSHPDTRFQMNFYIRPAIEVKKKTKMHIVTMRDDHKW